ncbi:hypothetical protein ACFL51_02075 [Myxococcota bacterium]
MKHCNIPHAWTGDEALAFVALLDRLTDAIWRAHGDKMARCLQRREGFDTAPCPSVQAAALDDDTVFDYEPIPFPGGDL